MTIAERWGVEDSECERPYPGDARAPSGHALYRGVTIDAPAATVFRWLCQLRAAPYSYDWIDNSGRRSPRQLTPGLEHLEVGQPVLSIFRLVAFEPDRSMTMVTRRAKWLFGEMLVDYVVEPIGPARVRLLMKITCTRGWLALPDLIMARRQLLNFKGLAEAS